MRVNLSVELIKKIIILIGVLVVANLFSSFFLGMLLAIGGNIKSLGINKLAFDPLITIAYILVYYFVTSFFQPSSRAQLYLFLFTLFLSFTISFIQGSIYLVIVYFLLRKFRII